MPVVGRGTLCAVLLAAMPAAGYYGRVENPVPVVQSISPAEISMRTGGTQVTLTGRNFVSNSTVTFNGQARNAALVNSTHLNLILRPQDLVEPGTFEIVVTNPPPGGGTATTHIVVKPSSSL